MKEGEATVLKGENRNEARCQNDFRTGTDKKGKIPGPPTPGNDSDIE